jgi:hypothetical protein
MSGHSTSYDSIGTASAAATLTAAYTGNTKTLLGKLLPRLHIDYIYTPKSGQTNRYAYVLIEASNDGGTTFFPLSVRQNIATDSKVYIEDLDGANGIPMIIPGDQTSTGGTAYQGFFDLEVDAEFVKVSAKESGSANFGTLYVRTTLSCD